MPEPSEQAYPEQPARSGRDAPEPRASDLTRLNLVGESAAFREVVRMAGRMATCDATILIEGETGTGKEVVARAIHYLGSRRGGPFIPVNCGAVPDSLVESEFFGHERGAFTDAQDSRAGVIAQAAGGTLFLDEIETLSPRGQVALLRFLQDLEYRPIGGAVVRNANVRVIAASNVDLGALANRGLYRQDLLFRLDVLSLRLPPLRERDRDALLLAEAFLQRLSRQYGRPAKALHPATVDYLFHYTWPGNVRELENLLSREFLLAEGNFIQIPAPGRTGPSGRPSRLTERGFQEAKARVIAEFERAYVAELLARTSGNVSMAARLAGKERSRLGKLIKKCGLDRSAFRAGPKTGPGPA